MKYTNKDAKIRLYDGTESGIDLTSTAIGAGSIEDSTQTWTINEWANHKVHITAGAASGATWEIISNTADTLTVNAFPVLEGMLIGDTFQLGDPWYFEICLDNGDFSGPIGIKKHEEILVLDRGLVTSCAHYINDNDAGIMEPMAITFTAMINDSQRFLWFMDWIEGNTVNGNTTKTTKGQSERIVLTGADLTFFDTSKKCFDLEYKMTGTTNNITYIFRECYFDLAEQTYAEAEDGVTLSISGMCYGRILRATDFTTGSDVTA